MMNQKSGSIPAASAARPKRYSALSTLTRSLLAAAIISTIVSGVAYLASGTGLWGNQRTGDNISDVQRQERASSFAAIGALELALVPDSETLKAVETMGLSSTSKQTLLSDLGAATQAFTTPVQDVQAATNVSPSPGMSPTRKPSVRLAWVTLWDTDAEDGDAVRIDSQGYSNTVLLTKQPVTFAIPVPADGVVNVTGIRDGEGGGVTVGLASGASKAIFPIMSVGQVLGLRVRVN